MKKKIILISLLSVATAVGVASTFGASSRGFKGFVIAENDPYRHYVAIGETCTTAGLKEYWTNCKGETTIIDPNESPYTEMSLTDSQAVLADLLVNNPTDERIIPAKGHNKSSNWSTDDTYHWHTCSNDDSEQLDKEEHYDLNGDYKCDECGYEFSAVASISIDYLTGYIGAGESVLLTANVTAYGDATTDVTWHLEKSDGNGWKNNPTKELSSVFTLTDNEDGTATLSSVYTTSTSEWSCFVYATSNYDTTVSSSKTMKIYTSTYGSEKRTTLNSFFGSDNWDMIPYIGGLTLTRSSDNNILTGKSSTRSAAQIINSFENLGIWEQVSVGASSATYTIDNPNNANEYYECDIAINLSNSKYGQITVTRCYHTWPTAVVASYVSDIGATGTVPAYDSGDGYKPMEDTGYYACGIVVSVQNANTALADYKEVLEDVGWFVYSSSGGDVYYGYDGKTLLINPYTKGTNKIVIDLYKSSSPVVAPLTSWPFDDIADALGDLTEEAAPSAEGTKFEIVSTGTNTISIKVYGSDTAYMTELVNRGYTLTKDDYYHKTYESPNETITAVIDIDYWGEGYFTVTFTSHLPAGVTTSFPLEEVKKIIGPTDANNIVAATGTKFKLTKNGDYDVSIIVTGGNKATFMAALEEAGFDSFMAGSYYKDNLCCDISGSEPYTINYYLNEKPVIDTSFWDTYVGDTIDNPITINGSYGEYKFILEFNNGTITGYEKGYKTQSLVTFTKDTVGCTVGQLHITASDIDWNYMDYDFIIEYDEINSQVNVVTNNSASNYSY